MHLHRSAVVRPVDRPDYVDGAHRRGAHLLVRVGLRTSLVVGAAVGLGHFWRVDVCVTVAGVVVERVHGVGGDGSCVIWDVNVGERNATNNGCNALLLNIRDGQWKTQGLQNIIRLVFGAIVNGCAKDTAVLTCQPCEETPTQDNCFAQICNGINFGMRT